MFIFKFIFAQQKFTGTVIDSVTKNIIPFATLEIMGKRLGTTANDKGIFYWNIDDKHFNDTVTISALGYYKKMILLKDMLSQNPIKIKLDSKVFDLPVYEIKNKTKPEIIKAGSKKLFMLFSGLYGSHGYITALYIKTDSNMDGILKSVGVYITKHGKPQATLQIRLFKVCQDSLYPGDDIIKEPILISGSDGGKWEDIDISKYHIPIPRNGFFLGVERVKTSEDYYFKGPFNDECYGPVLGHTSEFDKCITFFKLPGMYWYNVNGGGGLDFFNLMARARFKVWRKK